MPLYTCVLDYRGGTYIVQVRARRVSDGVLAWAKQLGQGRIPGIGQLRAKRLLELLARDRAQSQRYRLYGVTPLVGCVRVWCAGLPLQGALLNVIETGGSARGAG